MDEILKDVAMLYRMTAEMNVVAMRLKHARVSVRLRSVTDRFDPLTALAAIEIVLPTNIEWGN
ncbi:MAG: hypothetical protein KGL35_24980 [Bradyrhizobium sp.]|nr:hypothetical protein [Bradyrhizobium sp.]